MGRMIRRSGGIVGLRHQFRAPMNRFLRPRTRGGGDCLRRSRLSLSLRGRHEARPVPIPVRSLGCGFRVRILGGRSVRFGVGLGGGLGRIHCSTRCRCGCWIELARDDLFSLCVIILTLILIYFCVNLEFVNSRVDREEMGSLEGRV